MSLRQNIDIKESLEELRFIKKSLTSYKQFQKVDLLIMLKRDTFLKRQVSARALHISTRTQERWLAIYSDKGITDYLSKQQRSKPSKAITKEIHQGLEKRINSSSNCFKGYWDAHQWVNATYNTSVGYFNLRVYLIKHFGSKLKVPRKSHYKKSPQAVDGFLKNARSTRES